MQPGLLRGFGAVLATEPSRARVAPVLFRSHRKRGILTMGIMSGAQGEATCSAEERKDIW